MDPLNISGQFRNGGRPIDFSNDDGGSLAGLGATPAEVAAVDQACAEVDHYLAAQETLAAADPADDDPFAWMSLDQIIADGEAELRDGGAGLANPAGSAIELANNALDLEVQRQRQVWDQRQDARQPRQRTGTFRPTEYDRLAGALDEIAAGTYRGQDPALTFASPSEAGRALAERRWREHDPMTQVSGGQPCGFTDDLGRCGEPYHQHGCSALASPDVIEALRPVMRENAQRPFLPGSNGTLADHLEAETGQRQHHREEMFSPERRAVRAPFVPESRHMLGDPDADERNPYGPSMPDVSAVAARLGITPESAAGPREHYRAWRDRQVAARGPARHPDYAEGTRGQRTPVHMVPLPQPDDGLPGLAQYVAGS